MAFAAGPGKSTDTGATPTLPDRIVCTQVPVRDRDGAADPLTLLDSRGILPLGSRIVAAKPTDADSSPINLTPGFAAAGRPDLSFDAKRILFVAKKSADEPFAVWEMDIDGANARRVIRHSADCRDACYLSGLYTIDSERPADQIVFSSAMNGQAEALYTCRRDGSRIAQITYSPYAASDPLLLSDGRLLLSLWSPGDGAALFTINTDGTDVFPFAGLHEQPAVRSMPCETTDGSIVYVESAANAHDRGGSLVTVARTRSLHSRREIAPGAEGLDGLYRSPSPLPGGHLLVSYRSPRDVTYGVYVLDPRTGAMPARAFDDPAWHDIDAVAVYPRVAPPGRSSVVNDRSRSGKLYCLNAYASDTEASARIEPGTIKKARVIQAVVAPTPSGTRVNEVPLGEILVEEDGSFFLDVPARTPLRLETLDEKGEIVQAMHSWIWVMPQEPRGCIGCHEDRESTPPNRHPYALMKRPKVLLRAGEVGADPRAPSPKREGSP